MRIKYNQILLIYFFVLALLLCPPLSAYATTYYIDYNASDDSANGTSTSTPWKRCPGMVGFAGSYSHSAGDIFIFKGGVTWPSTTLPLTIGYSGAVDNIDTYTTDHSWYSGGAWSQPTFTSSSSTHVIYSNGKGYFKINDLNLISGSTLCDEGRYVILITPTTGANGTSPAYEISNNTLTHGMVGISFTSSASTINGIYIHGNRIQDTCNAMVMAGPSLAQSPNYYDNIRIYDNIISLVDTVDKGSDHIDGFQIFGAGSTFYEWPLTNMKIYNNQFRGIMKTMSQAMLNLQSINGLEIYNNLFAFENTTDDSSAYLVNYVMGIGYGEWKNNNIKVYNNTISSDANYSSDKGWKFGMWLAADQGTIDIKNNIFSNCEYGWYAIDTVNTVITSDYNFYRMRSGGRLIMTDAYWMTTVGAGSDPCTIYGWDCGSKSGDPEFIQIPTGTYLSGNFNLQETSLAIDAGVTVETFSTDIIGTGRPQGAAWDIGAYEYASGGDITAPTVDTLSVAESTVYINKFIVSWTCSDTVGVTGYKWRADAVPNASNGTALTSSPETVEGVLVSGDNDIYIGCYDAAGNYGTDLIPALKYVPSSFVGVSLN